MQTPPPTWSDLAWLREQWGGPFMIKGITRVDDARRAVDSGATAISVSNHGGNNLDGTPATIRALPAVVEAVGDDIEVVMDGGIRRGSDVIKGCRARGSGRDDRPRISLGPSGERAGRRRERPRHFARRHRFRSAGSWALRHPRLDPDDIVVPDMFCRDVQATASRWSGRAGSNRLPARITGSSQKRVYPGSEAAGVEQAAGDVVGQVPEAQGSAG